MENEVHILYVDDDIELSGLVQEYLSGKGMSVKLLHNPDDVLKNLQNDTFHLCLMDVKMPQKDGFTLAEEIQSHGIQIPFLFLTGQTRKEDRIRGLKLGAEDYISKPFSLEELYLRITNISKRVRTGEDRPETEFPLGKQTFFSDFGELRTENASTSLSTTEAKVLHILCRHMNKVVTRTKMLEDIWGQDDYHKGLSLNVYITRLRKRFSDNSAVTIVNEHGHGYKLLVR
ncbi:MAG: response regulator transcription factor [Bacteroidia bacterium]|nr:response regulator transcription factor [Bacteroidia bacterium]